MKKTFALLLCLLLLVIALPAGQWQELNPETFQCGLFYYQISGDGTATLTGVDKKTASWKANPTVVTVPRSLDGHPLAVIGQEAFATCYGVLGILLPEGITHIEKRAFEGCTDLVDLSLPEGLVSVGPRAFRATSISSLYLPDSLRELGDACFPFPAAFRSLALSASHPVYAVQNGMLFDK